MEHIEYGAVLELTFFVEYDRIYYDATILPASLKPERAPVPVIHQQCEPL